MSNNYQIETKCSQVGNQNKANREYSRFTRAQHLNTTQANRWGDFSTLRIPDTSIQDFRTRQMMLLLQKYAI